MYEQLEKWEEAEKDWSKAIESDDYKNEALIYYRRAICYALLKKRQKAMADVKMAFNLSEDPELDNALQKFWAVL